MPTYEYGCFNCNKTIEKVRPVAKRNASVRCECGAPCHKLVSGGQLAFVAGIAGRIGRDGCWCDSLPGPKVWVKNRDHYRELVKRGSREGCELIPVGLD